MKKEVVCFSLLLFTTILLGIHVAGCQGTNDQEIMKKKIDRIFTEFQNEKFIEEKEITAESGWIMTLPSGRTVTRSFLVTQATPIITFGNDAVPYLFNWVMSDNLAVQFIAVYSLQQITGLSPYISHFDKVDSTGNKEAAITIWRKWWEKQNK